MSKSKANGKSQKHMDAEARAKLDDSLHMSNILSDLVPKTTKTETRSEQRQRKAETEASQKKETNSALLQQLEMIEKFELK